MRAGEPYNPFRTPSRAAHRALTLGLLPTLVFRPAHDGAVILHDHGLHEFHAHTVSPSQLQDWCDEHQHWHRQPLSPHPDPPQAPHPGEPTNYFSFNDDFFGTIVHSYHALMIRQGNRIVLPLKRCTVVAGFGMFFGVPPGPSLERQCLLDDTSEPAGGGLTATAALLLRSHALLI